MNTQPTMKERRDVQVQVRLRPSENAALREQAKAMNTTASYLLRAALIFALKRPNEVVLID